MKKQDIVKLEMSPVGPWYSTLDETAFFEWLDKLNCVKKYEGRGSILTIEVLSSELTQQELLELIAIFYRYKVDVKQLAIFDREEFSDWFRYKKAYWYKRIFGK